jgi:hypothetical protein
LSVLTIVIILVSEIVEIFEADQSDIASSYPSGMAIAVRVLYGTASVVNRVVDSSIRVAKAVRFDPKAYLGASGNRSNLNARARVHATTLASPCAIREDHNAGWCGCGCGIIQKVSELISVTSSFPYKSESQVGYLK